MMDMRDQSQAEREAQRAQANREELAERIARSVPEDGVIQPLAGLHLARRSAPLATVPGVMQPSFCVIAQGSKEIALGDSGYRYDPFHYLLTTVELPTTSKILEASIERPYLSLRLELSPALVGSVMVETGQDSLLSPVDVRAIDVSPLDGDLLDAVVRLIRVIDSPDEAYALTPLIMREIIYRLLTSNQRSRLQHLAMMSGYTPYIARAVERLRQTLDQPLRMEQIAHELGMSVSGLHHRFKAVTAMSPLQFQKRLRLQEARRLMLDEHLDAANAAYRVGYQDASHFNREYKSLFGEPPRRDVQRLREEALVSTGQ